MNHECSMRDSVIVLNERPLIEKGKPGASRGRKATGPTWSAELPKGKVSAMLPIFVTRHTLGLYIRRAKATRGAGLLNGEKIVMRKFEAAGRSRWHNVWVVVAALLVVGGGGGALFAAGSVARNDGTDTGAVFTLEVPLERQLVTA